MPRPCLSRRPALGQPDHVAHRIRPLSEVPWTLRVRFVPSKRSRLRKLAGISSAAWDRPASAECPGNQTGRRWSGYSHATAAPPGSREPGEVDPCHQYRPPSATRTTSGRPTPGRSISSGDKWTLLIIRDLAAGPRRFVELQRVLPGISTEQLRSRLNRMVADGLLTRQRYREVPPRVDYELTERSRELMPVLGALARWGYDWTWGSPRPGEDVNVGAIFRLAPGMLVAARGRRGHGRVRGRRPRRPARAPLPAHARRRPRRDHRAGAERARAGRAASAARSPRGSARSAPRAAPASCASAAAARSRTPCSTGFAQAGVRRAAAAA